MCAEERVPGEDVTFRASGKQVMVHAQWRKMQPSTNHDPSSMCATVQQKRAFRGGV